MRRVRKRLGRTGCQFATRLTGGVDLDSGGTAQMCAGKSRILPQSRMLLKLGVAVGVVTLVFYVGLIRVDDLARAARSWVLLCLALAAILSGMIAGSLRWSILLRAQGIREPIPRLVTLTMTGFFFSVVAPGGLGGDAVKAYYAGRGSRRPTEAVTVILLDRVLGFVSLFVVAGIVIVVDFDRLWRSDVEGMRLLGLSGGRVIVVLVSAVIGASAGAGLFLTSKRVRQSRLLRRLSRSMPFRTTVARVYNALHLYGDHRGAVVAAVAISIATQVPLYLSYSLYAAAVGANLTLWQCALVVPPAMVIRALPLVPGGAGQGAVAFAAMLPLVGCDKGGGIGALGDMIFIIAYLIGGLFFVFGNMRHSAAHTLHVETD